MSVSQGKKARDGKSVLLLEEDLLVRWSGDDVR